jgi:chromosome segregation ATPase
VQLRKINQMMSQQQNRMKEDNKTAIEECTGIYERQIQDKDLQIESLGEQIEREREMYKSLEQELRDQHATLVSAEAALAKQLLKAAGQEANLLK